MIIMMTIMMIITELLESAITVILTELGAVQN